MEENEISTWLDKVLPKQKILTDTVVNIIVSLLDANNIDYLAVSGRTKNPVSIREKIKRKSYSDPEIQMTDLSGIRIIAYFESDVEKISLLIERAFNVDRENSLSKDSLLATDQIGYRSIHYVCDLGDSRTALPEFSSLEGMKFEFQVRTVLQHAWAELAHDKNYKFSGKLPKEIERKLYLYAGMLEIADKGFDELSSQIDLYIEEFNNRTSEGDFDIEINSISLEEYVRKWAKNNDYPLEEYSRKTDFSDLVNELNELGIRKIYELKNIIPKNFAEISRERGYSSNIYGLLRDWMLIHDYKRYHEKVSYNWSDLALEEGEIFSAFLNPDQVTEICNLFSDQSIAE